MGYPYISFDVVRAANVRFDGANLLFLLTNDNLNFQLSKRYQGKNADI